MPSQKDGTVRPTPRRCDEHDAEPEGRDGEAEHRADAQRHVGASPSAARHQAAERHRGACADHEREEGELERRPDIGQDLLGDRTAGPKRGAEVAVKRREGPAQILDEERLIEADPARSSESACGVTSLLAPSMMATASPGMRRIIRKTITDTPATTSTRSMSRGRRRRLSIEALPEQDRVHRSPHRRRSLRARTSGARRQRLVLRQAARRRRHGAWRRGSR